MGNDDSIKPVGQVIEGVWKVSMHADVYEPHILGLQVKKLRNGLDLHHKSKGRKAPYQIT
jgi:hypothetical protein